MPRITISIPADLKRHLANARIRKGLNVSRVCQEALKREVRRMLHLPMELERMELLLDRLHEERRQQADRWHQEGASAARDWVEHEAPYPALRALGEAPQERRIAMLRTDPPQALQDQLAANQDREDFSLTNYLTGWASTIGIMWEVIKKNL